MNKILFFLLTLIILAIAPTITNGQLPATIIRDGRIRTNEGMLIVPLKNKYNKLSDSLDKNLNSNSSDTTSLFFKALILFSYNQKLAEPYQRTKGTMENLVIAKDLVEKALTLKMVDFRAKLLRAQIYSELCYRFSGDESWMFKKNEVEIRGKRFASYKELANKYYDQLAKEDELNAHLYQKYKITDKYILQK